MLMVKTCRATAPLAAVGIMLCALAASPALARDCAPPPPGAIVVAPGGDDRAAGTAALPLATVGAALARARAGDTVALRAGTYRESLSAIERPLVLRAFGCEQATIRGSRVVSGWRRDGPRRWSAPWPHRFCAGCAAPGNIVPERPHAGLPDQAFLDGAPLEQVVRRDALRPGTFMVAGGRLHLGDDPGGRVVEAVVHSHALTIRGGGAGTRVVGLAFEHFSPAAEPGLGAMVRGDAADLEFTGNRFAWSAAKGLSIFAPGAVVRGNTFADNGMMGLEAWRADGLMVEGNRFLRNNREGFAVTGTVSEAAGAKITETHAPLIRRNVFAGNHATGLWLDIDVIGALVERNEVRDNARHGIFHEISAGGTIRGNRVVGNAVSGIALADSANVRVEGNEVANNGIGLLVQDDDREKPDKGDGNTWRSGGHVITSNSFRGDGPLLWVRDFTGRMAARDMVGRLRGNRYALGRGPFAVWWSHGRETLFASPERFRAETGLER